LTKLVILNNLFSYIIKVIKFQFKFLILILIFIILTSISLFYIRFAFADHSTDSSIASSNSGSTVIHYSINPIQESSFQQKENRLILNLRFTDFNNNIIHDIIKYNITIKSPDNNIIFVHFGFANNGEDSIIIDNSNFIQGNLLNPSYYQLWLEVLTIGDKVVNEKTIQPILINLANSNDTLINVSHIDKSKNKKHDSNSDRDSSDRDSSDRDSSDRDSSDRDSSDRDSSDSGGNSGGGTNSGGTNSGGTNSGGGSGGGTNSGGTNSGS
jgi:uncharacterized membrane protein YgcG